MDYQFYIDPITETPVAELNSEHELVGRWLTDEVGQDAVILVQVMRALERAPASSGHEFELHGREISLSVSEQEASLTLNASHNNSQTGVGLNGADLSDQLDPHLSEQLDSVACGADDLAHLLRAWQSFITR